MLGHTRCGGRAQDEPWQHTEWPVTSTLCCSLGHTIFHRARCIQFSFAVPFTPTSHLVLGRPLYGKFDHPVALACVNCTYAIRKYSFLWIKIFIRLPFHVNCRSSHVRIGYLSPDILCTCWYHSIGLIGSYLTNIVLFDSNDSSHVFHRFITRCESQTILLHYVGQCACTELDIFPLPYVQFPSVAPIHRFLGGNIFYGVGEKFFLRLHAKSIVSAPPIKAIHVLKCTKACNACTYIEHWIIETNKQFFFRNLGGRPPAPPPQSAPLVSIRLSIYPECMTCMTVCAVCIYSINI